MSSIWLYKDSPRFIFNEALFLSPKAANFLPTVDKSDKNAILSIYTITKGGSL